ncbi:SpaH/EbpB family LPXTG-anchored major pilin [Enterococcus sp.]|uniref:SpaH/EbpB family LPXTG-anchored major pilin n=1 Tax=Enterococcus sp. TaxID=35783 RepID=UPI00290DB802|nr:SpaH/EbpB family LPXTG-anchored major pilin [Enterococcus sp.]MDU5336209.1 SpaH/EbpB family LPXTG-anchored major pilin [Enterococcus sp.]
MKKLVKLIMMLAITLPFFSCGADRVEAGEADMITFNLHKIVFPEHGIPGASQDEANENSGLNGVTFDVYDVTDDFYQLLERSDDKSVRDAQAELQGMDLSNRKFIEQQMTATINEEEGIANFNLPRKSEGRDAVYLFRESAAPSDVKSKAADMVVALPVLNLSGEPVEEPINLYPKNEIIQQPFEKVIVDQQQSYQMGDEINYELTTKLPSSLSMYSKYWISDQADKSLTFDVRSLVVQIANENFTGYQAEISDHEFKLVFDLEKLKPYAGKDLSISYAMILTDKSKVDLEILNRAELETDFDTISQEKKLKTGGKKFIKVDEAVRDKTLFDAAFVVKNSQGKYLQKKDKGYYWSNKKEGSDLVKLSSNKDGFFEIKGLRYGDYFLEEIEPPVGYVLSEKAIKFEVSENSYAFSEGILQVTNQKSAAISKKLDEPRPMTMETKKQQPAVGLLNILPKTNDLKNYLLMIIGGFLLIILAVILAIRNRRKRSS